MRRYVRAVSRELICSKTTRSQLLDGLQQELSAYAALPYNELCATVGNPEQIAEQLMESVDKAEIYATKRKHWIIIAFALGILVAFLLILITYATYAQEILQGDFYMKQTTSEGEEQIVSDGMLED